MVYANFHTHCMFCDGEGHPEEYVKSAIAHGFVSIGFSSHAPLPYKNGWTMRNGSQVQEYCRTIRSLKEEYKGKIQIYLGAEIDCYPGIVSPDQPGFKALNLDYAIGSVHFIYDEGTGEYLSIDGDEDDYIKIINNVFKGNTKHFVQSYYTLIRDMVSKHTPDIVGHIDLIKKNNRDGKYFNENEPWYRKELMETLRSVAESGAILEINTGGISRGYMDTFYPSPWALDECRRLKIPVVLSSDAHKPENIDAYFDMASNALKEAGYSTQRILLDGVWRDVSIDRGRD